MTLPLVLAGPLLRRAEPERVHVWLATSQPLELEGEVYEVRSPGRAPTLSPTLSRQSDAASVRLGQRLWVHLIAISPSRLRATASVSERNMPTGGPPFPTGRILAYDLIETGGAHRRLRDLVRLEDVVLPSMPLPTFALQPRGRPLHILYASCRKPHGEGDDSMAAAERVLQDGAADPGNRLTALMLGGDQIYADDVADLLARPLSQLAFELTGRRETVPDLPQPHTIPVHGRADLVRDVAKFTSGEAHNHLLTFGEFAAMYLLAWNLDNWPSRLPEPMDTWNAMGPGRPPMNSWIGDWRRQFDALERAKAGVRAARRVLANVPTYMVFDDHEITDDWNLNPGWTRDVLGSRAGARILLNGLAAYWAFQAWGNDPASFPPDTFIAPVQRYCETESGESEARRTLLDHDRWSYKAPTDPPMVVLNTRTRREGTRTLVDSHNGFPVPRNWRTSRLMGAAERARAASLAARRQGMPLIVVAPTPIFGVETIEAVQSLIGWASPAGVDLESWRANPRSFLDAADFLVDAAPSPAIVLSGDVHYAFSAAIRLAAGRQTVPVAQFTSSATKNETRGGAGVGASVLGSFQQETSGERYWWRRPGDTDAPLVTVTEDLLLPLVRLAVGRDPDLVERATFTQLGGAPGNLMRQAILMTSNVGELWVEGSRVRHRFWTQSGGRTHDLAPVSWATAAWPI